MLEICARVGVEGVCLAVFGPLDGWRWLSSGSGFQGQAVAMTIDRVRFKL